jgi:acyl phosphate:glycerol-3-phosphate acyltransferase
MAAPAIPKSPALDYINGDPVSMTPFLLTAALSYLLGSVPFGYVLVRVFCGQDIRQSGSGNIGATNVARSSSILGGLTLLLDVLKGMSAVLLSRVLFPGQELLTGVAGLFAVLGHIFTPWLRFRGGKGVATGLGSFLLLAPKAILIIMGVFVAVVMSFRYVSLASIIAVGLFPLAVWLLNDYKHQVQMIALMAASSVLIIVKHSGNIRRLVARTEPRFQLRRG